LYKHNLTKAPNVLVAGGSPGEPFAAAVKETLGATGEVAQRSELQQFVVMPQR
jgi:hypothetical protein